MPLISNCLLSKLVLKTPSITVKKFIKNNIFLSLADFWCWADMVGCKHYISLSFCYYRLLWLLMLLGALAYFLWSASTLFMSYVRVDLSTKVKIETVQNMTVRAKCRVAIRVGSVVGSILRNHDRMGAWNAPNISLLAHSVHKTVMRCFSNLAFFTENCIAVFTKDIQLYLISFYLSFIIEIHCLNNE